MRKSAVALAILSFIMSGCSTMNNLGITFENRVACSVAGDKAFVVSEYGGAIGISSKLSDKDLPALLKACKG